MYASYNAGILLDKEIFMKKLKDNIYYIGALNPNMRVFDIIMKTEYGTSYNSYLIKGEKTAIIETVHDRFSKSFFADIEEITSSEKIDYIIFNHTEPDHSGSLAKLIEKNPQIKVFGTSAAIRNLNKITNMPFDSVAVKTGDTLDLGNGMILEFVTAPNLHWPDSMFTYLREQKTVFTCDFLGSHYCEPAIIDEDITYPHAYWSAFENYYTAIMGPFKKFVFEGIKKLEALDFDMICTSHGPVLKKNIAKTMQLYKEWSTPKEHEKNATIFYVSAYGYTKAMAETIEAQLNELGIKAKSYDIICHDFSEFPELIENSDALLFGSPTINRDALKPVWDVLSIVDAVSNRGKPVMFFGSYGWSGEACKLLEERAKGLSLKVFEKSPRIVFKPSDSELEELKVTAKEFAETL